MRFVVGILACVVLSASALADDKVLVLKAEGRADKKVRTKIEGAVLKLAQVTSTATTPGDITYVDAAAMVGCKPDEDKCKDEVIGMLSVDEIVTISTTAKPGGIEVSVRRITKGGATKTATAVVTADKADQLDALAPLFGKDAPPSPLPPPVKATPPATATQPPMREPVREPAPLAPPTAKVPPPTQVADPSPPPATAMPVDQPRDDRSGGGRRLSMFGMAGGGALLVVGVVFWASAANIEDEIDRAPKRTVADLEHIRDLESEGDGYATAGNVLVVSGLVLGGVSTYFFLKSGKRSSRSARVTPTLMKSGGGVAVTWGL